MSASINPEPITRPFDAAITPPGSKSLSNRALVMAAMSDGIVDLDNLLFADDTLVMLESLTRLGFKLIIDRPDRRVRLHGCGGRIPKASADLFVGNSGTTIRFLTAMLTLGRGSYSLDGIARMRQRPIGGLVRMLKNLGARIDYSMQEGMPPLRIDADTLAGGFVRYGFGNEDSSQFLSALLMAAPYARNEVKVTLGPDRSSWPYVEMTMRLMDEFGHTVELERDEHGDPSLIVVSKGKYKTAHHTIEPDASNASYFLAAAAINPGSRVRIDNLGHRSLQGDAKFCSLLRKMGADVHVQADSIQITGTDELEGIDADLSLMPDMAQTLGVAAIFAKGPTTLRGIHSLRKKETDRIEALRTELSKMGANVDLTADDVMTIHPPFIVDAAAIDTYDDHRMAMSFAVASTRVAGVVINDPACVNKTYPEFFQDLEKCVRASANAK